jgi:hypothetical protein
LHWLAPFQKKVGEYLGESLAVNFSVGKRFPPAMKVNCGEEGEFHIALAL